MVRKHQIVEGIPAEGDSPVVVFDFDEWFTLGVGTDFSPPEVRTSNTWTQLNDGETTGASTLGDRVIRLVLTQFRGNAEDQAEVLQTLARLLDDSAGQWFLWHDEGTVHPRYFRTRRTSISIEDHYLVERPKRTVTLSIPAAPVALGDLVEGEYVVTNDPTSGTNPMVIEIDGVQGDIPTPLWLSLDYSDTSITVRNIVLAGSAAPPDVDGGIVLCDAGTIVGATSWTRAVVGDATAIGGSLVRFTRVGSTYLHTIAASIPAVERGDYRVMVRARAVYSVGGAVALWAWAGVGDNTDTPSGLTPVAGNSVHANWGWIDIGLYRFPGGSALYPDRPETDLTYPMTSSLLARLRIFDPTGTSLDIDTFALIPAGLDRSKVATMLRTSQNPTFPDSQAWIDGINDTTYLVADDDILDTTKVEPLVSDGDTPYLSPGVLNRVFLMPNVKDRDDVAAPADVKTDTITVRTKHRPQYLYIRSATG